MGRKSILWIRRISILAVAAVPAALLIMDGRFVLLFIPVLAALFFALFKNSIFALNSELILFLYIPVFMVENLSYSLLIFMTVWGTAGINRLSLPALNTGREDISAKLLLPYLRYYLILAGIVTALLLLYKSVHLQPGFWYFIAGMIVLVTVLRRLIKMANFAGSD